MDALRRLGNHLLYDLILWFGEDFDLPETEVELWSASQVSVFRTILLQLMAASSLHALLS